MKGTTISVWSGNRKDYCLQQGAGTTPGVSKPRVSVPITRAEIGRGKRVVRLSREWVDEWVLIFIDPFTDFDEGGIGSRGGF